MDEPKLLLVVEDMPGIRELLELTLRFKQYEVMGADNGQEALKMIQQRSPALIVSDILMPHMDGFTLIYHLRQDQKTRNIPVLFLSATYVTPEDKEFANSLGAARFIEKPIDMETFLSTVAELLQQAPVVPPPTLKEDEFLANYKLRLEAKLEQKNRQIARAQQLLPRASIAERTGFESSLRQAMSDRQSITAELERVQDTLQRRSLSQ